MGTRRRAREVALQFLYQLDLQGEDDPVPHEQEFWARHALSGEARSEEHTSELQSRQYLVCRLLLEKKKKKKKTTTTKDNEMTATMCRPDTRIRDAHTSEHSS